MIITENFALLDILRAIEKLSPTQADKKDAPNAAEQEAAEQKSADGNKKQTARSNFCLAENLLTRHEREVNRIKRGKK